MRTRPCVTVVVVTYQSSRKIGECLRGIERCAPNLVAVCRVVDNQSSDDTVLRVRKEFPNVNLLAQESNLGFAKASNLGACEAKTEFLLFLNPDSVLLDEALAELVHFLDHRPEAAGCGPMIVDPQEQFQTYSRRSFPTPGNTISRTLGLDRFSGSNYLMSNVPPDRELLADCLSGSCMLVRRTDFEAVGGFDEDYFLFGEDIDLCWKLHRNNRELWYVPSARTVHEKGSSMRQNVRVANREFYRSMLLYIDKRLSSRYSRISREFMKLSVRLLRMLSSFGGR